MLPKLTDMRFDYGPTFAQNLFSKLFDIALAPGRVTDYRSDLGHDAISLSRAEPGDLYMWGWRPYGTHMVHIRRHKDTQAENDKGLASAKQFLKLNGVIHPDNIYVLFVTKKHGNGRTCEGHVWRLLDGYADHMPEAAKVQEASIRLGLITIMAEGAAMRLYTDVRA